MSIRKVSHIYMTMLLLGMTACLAACGTLGEQYVERATASIHEAQDELTQAKAQIEGTMSKLNVLVNQKEKDMRQPYKLFVRQLAESEVSKEGLRDRLEEMKTDGDTYFQVWERELESFSNPEIRERCEKRRNTALESYQQVTETVQATIDSFDLLLVDLRDIRRYLDIDLTSGGIAAISEVIDKANADSAEVKDLIDSAIRALDRMASDLSPQNGE